MEALPDRLRHEREERGDRVLHRFAGGLVVETEVLLKPDPRRILPLGGPQRILMNHLACFPERVRDRRVFEPFAGSGGLGLMALSLGAAHVDWLDVNPRAVAFQRENAARNGFPPERFRALEGDVAHHRPERPYDVIVANPPFVPTPDGVEGTLTSRGGPDGGHFARLLLDRTDELLAPSGRALVYVYELVADGRPLMASHLERTLPDRPVALTATQARPAPLAVCVEAYERIFPDAREAIHRWRDALERLHGPDLGWCHYVVEVGPRPGAGDAPPGCVLRDDLEARFGPFRIPAEAVDELAFGRVLENLVPEAPAPPARPARPAPPAAGG